MMAYKTRTTRASSVYMAGLKNENVSECCMFVLIVSITIYVYVRALCTDILNIHIYTYVTAIAHTHTRTHPCRHSTPRTLTTTH